MIYIRGQQPNTAAKQCHTQPKTLSFSVRIYCSLSVDSCPDFAWMASCMVWYNVTILETSKFNWIISEFPCMPSPLVEVVIRIFKYRMCYLHVSSRFVHKMPQSRYAKSRCRIFRQTIYDCSCQGGNRFIRFQCLDEDVCKFFWKIGSHTSFTLAIDSHQTRIESNSPPPLMQIKAISSCHADIALFSAKSKDFRASLSIARRKKEMYALTNPVALNFGRHTGIQAVGAGEFVIDGAWMVFKRM